MDPNGWKNIKKEGGNGEYGIDQQKAELRNNNLQSINDNEENLIEENRHNIPIVEGNQEEGWFTKNKKSILIISVIVFAIVGIIFLAVLLSGTKTTLPRGKLAGLVLTRQFQQYDTYKFNKKTEFCVKYGQEKDQTNCQKVYSHHMFTVVNITDTPVNPEYFEYSESKRNLEEEDSEKTETENIGQIFTISLWIKELTMYDAQKKTNTTIVSNSITYNDGDSSSSSEKRRRLSESFGEDFLKKPFDINNKKVVKNTNKQNSEFDLDSELDLGYNVYAEDAETEAETSSESSEESEDDGEAFKYNAIIFFSVWDSGKIHKIYKPEGLEDIVYENMIILIKDFNPNLNEDLYYLTDSDKRRRLAEEEQFGQTVSPDYNIITTDKSDTMLRKTVNKESYVNLELPSNSVLDVTQTHSFDKYLTLKEVNDDAEVAFSHNQENEGDMPKETIQDYFASGGANIGEESFEDLTKKNFIPNSSAMTEISTKVSATNVLTEKKVLNKDEASIMLFLAIQPSYTILNLSSEKITEEDGGEAIEKDINENGEVKSTRILLPKPTYNPLLQKKLLERSDDSNVTYMVNPPKNLNKEINEVFRRQLAESTDMDDMKKTHSIIYPAFNIDVYGIKLTMSVMVDVCPGEDYVETSIVVSANGLFTIPLFKRKDNVELSDSVNKMFDYIKKGTDIIATTVSIIDKFLGTEYLDKIKGVVQVANRDADSEIKTEAMFVDQFAVFISSLKAKLVEVKNTFVDYINKNLDKFKNPLNSWQNDFYALLKDLYNTYLSELNNYLEEFIDNRKNEFNTLHEKLKGGETLVFPDMIEFIQDAKSYIRSKLVETELPGTVHTPFVGNTTKKIVDIFDKTRLTTKNIQEKIEYFFNSIPFNEVKALLSHIQSEIQRMFTEFDTLLAKYESYLNDNFMITDFNFLETLSKAFYNEFVEPKIDEIVDDMNSLMKEGYGGLAIYKELYELVKAIITNTSSLSVKDLSKYISFPALDEVINTAINTYYSKYNDDTNETINIQLLETIVNLILEFDEQINNITHHKFDIDIIIDTVTNPENTKQVIKENSVITTLSEIIDKTEIDDTINKLVAYGESERKLVVCSDYVLNIKETIEFYTDIGVAILNNIKEFNLQDYTQFVGIKSVVSDVIQIINPLFKAVNSFSAKETFALLDEEAILAKIDSAQNDVNDFINTNYEDNKKLFDDIVTSITQKIAKFDNVINKMFSAKCDGSKDSDESSSDSSSESTSDNSSESSSESTSESTPDSSAESSSDTSSESTQSTPDSSAESSSDTSSESATDKQLRFLDQVSSETSETSESSESSEETKNPILVPNQDASGKQCLLFDITEAEYKQMKEAIKKDSKITSFSRTCLIYTDVLPKKLLNTIKLLKLKTEKAKDLLNYITSKISDVKEFVNSKATLLEKAKTAIEAIEPASFKSALDKIKTFEEKINDTFMNDLPNSIKTQMSGVIDTGSNYILNTLSSLLDIGVNLVDKFDKIPEFVIAQLQALKDYIDKTSFSTLIKTTWLENAEEKANNICSKIMDVRNSNFVQQYDYFLNKQVSKIPNSLQDSFTTILNELKSTMDKIFQFGTSVCSGIVDAVSNVIKEKINAFLDKFNTLISNKLDKTIEKAKSKSGEENPDQALDLNGYFTIVDVYNTIETISSLIGFVDSNNNSVLNLNLGLINLEVSESMNRVTIRINASNNSKIEAVSAIKSFVLKKAKSKFTELINTLTTKIDNSDFFVSKFNSYISTYSDYLQEYLDEIEDEVNNKIETWRESLMTKVNTQISTYSKYINDKTVTNFDNFVTALYAKINDSTYSDYSEQQNIFIDNFFSYVDTLKAKYISGLAIDATDKLTENEIKYLNDIGISSEYINEQITNINTHIASKIQELVDSEKVTSLTQQQLLNLTEMANKSINNLKSKLVDTLTTIKRKLSELANANATALSNKQFSYSTDSNTDLEQMVADKEAEATQKILDVLLASAQEVYQIIKISNNLKNDIVSDKAIFDYNIFSIVSLKKEQIIEPFFKEISKLIQILTNKLTDIVKDYDFESIASDVMSQTLSSMSKSLETLFNKAGDSDLGKIIKTKGLQVFNSAKEVINNQYNKVTGTIENLISEHKTTSLHLLSIVTFAAKKGIDPLSNTLESIYDKYADKAVDYFSSDLKSEFKTVLNNNISNISDQQLRDYLLSYSKSLEVNNLIDALFDKIKASAESIKSEVKTEITGIIGTFKTEVETLFDNLKTKVKAATESSDVEAASDFVYKTINYITEALDNFVLPLFGRYDELVNSSDEMQKQYFKDLTEELIEKGLNKILEPVDTEVFAFIDKMADKVEATITPPVKQYIIDPIDSAKQSFKDLAKSGINSVLDYIEQTAEKLLNLLKKQNDESYVIELRALYNTKEYSNKSIVSQSFQELNGSSINIKDIINTAKSLTNVFSNFKAIMKSIPDMQSLKKTVNKVIDFAKNGASAFIETIEERFVPILIMVGKEHLNSYIKYSKQKLVAKSQFFIDEYERIKSEVLNLPNEILSMALDLATDRLVSIANDNKSTFAVELGKNLITIQFYKYTKEWTWEYSYTIYFAAGPVPMNIKFSLAATTGISFATGFADLGLYIDSSVFGAVKARASGGVTSGLVEVNAFIEGTIINLTGTFSNNLSILEFSFSSQICFTGQLGQVDAGLSVKTGIPGVKQVCSNIKTVKKTCQKILGFFGLSFICKVVDVIEVVCKVVSYISFENDFLSFKIVRPYTYQKCLGLSLNNKRRMLNNDMLELPGH